MTTKSFTIEEWVKALRSGRYKQGKNRLRSRDGDQLRYCCLGVACNLAKLNWREAEEDDYYNSYGIADADSNVVINWVNWAFSETAEDDLQKALRADSVLAAQWEQYEDWTAAAYVDLRFFKVDTADVLVYLNDAGRTFEEIADFIEAMFRPKARIRF